MENKNKSFISKLIMALFILIMIITFSINNSQGTDVKFWFWTSNAPLILLFLTCFIAGVIFALLGIMPIYRGSRKKSKLIEELKVRIDSLEKQISESNY